MRLHAMDHLDKYPATSLDARTREILREQLLGELKTLAPFAEEVPEEIAEIGRYLSQLHAASCRHRTEDTATMRKLLTAATLLASLGACMATTACSPAFRHATYLKAPYEYDEQGIASLHWKNTDPGRHFANPFRGREGR